MFYPRFYNSNKSESARCERRLIANNIDTRGLVICELPSTDSHNPSDEFYPLDLTVNSRQG